MFTLYRISFCAGTQLEQVAHARQTSTTSCRSDWSREFGEIIPISIMNICISSYPLPSRYEYLFTLHQSVVQNLFNTWHSTFQFSAAQLHSVTKMATKSLCYYVWTESLPGMIFAPVQQRAEVWRHVTMVALFLDDNKTNDDGDSKEYGKK